MEKIQWRCHQLHLRHSHERNCKDNQYVPTFWRGIDDRWWTIYVEWRYGYPVCSCSWRLSSYIGFTCWYSLTGMCWWVEKLTKHDKVELNAQFEQFFDKGISKKVQRNKDTFVQRSYYRFLGSIARNILGTHTLRSLLTRRSCTAACRCILCLHQKGSVLD